MDAKVLLMAAYMMHKEPTLAEVAWQVARCLGDTAEVAAFPPYNISLGSFVLRHSQRGGGE